MKCMTTNCEHKVRKGASSKQPLSNSWRIHKICVCCMRELVRLNKQLVKEEFLEEYYRQSSLCTLANKLEKKVQSEPLLLNRVSKGERRQYNMITVI